MIHVFLANQNIAVNRDLYSVELYSRQYLLRWEQGSSAAILMPNFVDALGTGQQHDQTWMQPVRFN